MILRSKECGEELVDNAIVVDSGLYFGGGVNTQGRRPADLLFKWGKWLLSLGRQIPATRPGHI